MVFICWLSAQYTLHGVKTQGLLSDENSPRENMKIYDLNTHLLKSVQTSGGHLFILQGQLNPHFCKPR